MKTEEEVRFKLKDITDAMLYKSKYENLFLLERALALKWVLGEKTEHWISGEEMG
jgi:hypothetical protein